MDDYFSNPVGHLVTIKCSPWYSNNTVILGDAAHAIVPFYGQGMNASLEDADYFDDLLDACGGDIPSIFPKFFEARKPAADAISKLSHENYFEMRAHVASRLFLMRKSIESVVHRIMPNTFIPLYSMVAFSTIPYHKVIERDQKQSKIFDCCLFVGTIVLVVPPFRNSASNLLSNLRFRIKSAL